MSNHLWAKRVIFTRSITMPDQDCVLAQAKLFAGQAECVAGALPAILIHDSDSRFGKAFDQALWARRVRLNRLFFRSPQLNAFAERWIRSIRGECLNKFVILGRHHLDHLVGECTTYYHRHRPHQGKGNELLVPPSRPPPSTGKVDVRKSLGGALVRYERWAA